MARPRTYKTQGIVLRQMPLGEADRILTLYTPDLGKVRAVARGVRRTKSRLSGHLEILTHVRVSVAEGRSLDAITEAETIHSFRGLREDLPLVTKAVYLAELVDSFSTEQSPGATIFELLLGALDDLQTAEGPDQLLRQFEVQLLKHSGFGPELYRCVECRTVLEPGDHLFSCAAGGVLCPQCRTRSVDALLPLSLNAMKVLRYFQHEDQARVGELKVTAALLNELERILRTYIRYVLERDVKSAEFMNLVSGSRSAAT